MSATDREMNVMMGLGAPDDPVDITIVLPAYNEVDSVLGMHEQLTKLLSDQPYSYEFLWVDDGSTDGTWREIEQVCAQDPRVRALRHRRNFGKASALANGFTYARGEIIVTTDADMQYEPTDILRLIEKVNEGWDVVSAYKVVRRDPLSKRIPSWFFNFWVRNTTGVQLHDINAGLKAFRYEAAEALIRYGHGELHRFFMILAARNGFRVAEVPVESCYRTNGRSKYGIERYMRGALDYLTVFFLSGYAERPLHLLGAAGVWSALLGTLLFAGSAVVDLVPGAPDVSSAWFIGAALLVTLGMQMLVSGLIAEMITNLERPTAGRAKIAQVLRVDRRTSLLLAPGVQIERRHAVGRSQPPSGPLPSGVDRRGADRATPQPIRPAE